MFNSRGVNLAVIGAARLALDEGANRSDEMFASAKSYLEALNYKAGLTTVDAIQARALLDAGRPGDAAAVAKRAAIFAAQNGHADLLWQIEALRGEALATLGQHREAERAFRNAQDAIDAVSGALASDSSKRQFGIGKEEITRRLANYKHRSWRSRECVPRFGAWARAGLCRHDRAGERRWQRTRRRCCCNPVSIQRNPFSARKLICSGARRCL